MIKETGTGRYLSVASFRGLSTDTKPTNVDNGAEFLEIDTGDIYLFNEANHTWVKCAMYKPTDAQAEEYIGAWLDEHPEATTTVQDGAVTTAKLADGAVTDAKLAQTGGILEEVDELKNYLKNNILDGHSPYYEMLETISTSYRGLHPTTGLPFETGSPVYHIYKASVTPTKAYLLTASTRGRSSSCFYSFFNNSDEVVLKGENSQTYDETTTENLIDKYVIAPETASYVLVADYFELGRATSGAKGAVSEIYPAVSEIDNRIRSHEFVNNHFVDITASLTLEAGYLDNNGATVAYESAETTDFLEINAFPHYIVSGSPIYSSNRLWAVYDQFYTVLHTYKNNTFEYDYDFNSEAILEDYPTAKYVKFSSVFASPGIHLVVKRSSYTDEAGSYAINLLKPWNNKRWVCVGDSLTEVNSKTTKHYFDYIAEKTGISIVNMGLSGSGYKHQTSSGTGAFYQRISNVPTDADVVTIFGSGNDLTHEYTLGTPIDTGTETICGCINTTLDTLIGIIPTVQLGIVAPTPWVNFPPSTPDNAMELYVEALRKICANRSIPFLDLYHCSNLRPWTAEGRSACYSKDDGNGVHPDETGHKIIAPRFEAFLDSLLLR